jgi:alpha-ketoglutarate-dependent taurine dioxygenase
VGQPASRQPAGIHVQLREGHRGPLARAHRHTGRKGLFISTGALRLIGVTEAESQALLPFLQAHASSPNYTVGFGWKPGDFVRWDNLATWHYAVNDYDGPRAYRKVIGG